MKEKSELRREVKLFLLRFKSIKLLKIIMWPKLLNNNSLKKNLRKKKGNCSTELLLINWLKKLKIFLRKTLYLLKQNKFKTKNNLNLTIKAIMFHMMEEELMTFLLINIKMKTILKSIMEEKLISLMTFLMMVSQM